MRLHRREAYPGFEQAVLAAAPELDAAMEMVIEAWRDLESERSLGFGVVGFIPYRALRAWAEDEQVDLELFKVLKTVIQRLDADRAERAAAERACERPGER